MEVAENTRHGLEIGHGFLGKGRELRPGDMVFGQPPLTSVNSGTLF
jgi:hypothetical protein